MITFFNRKKLLTDTSSMEVARVTSLLKENQIPYDIVTKRDQTALGNMVRANMTSSMGGGGTASYHQVNGTPSFTYHIYVNKNDYDHAKKIID